VTNSGVSKATEIRRGIALVIGVGTVPRGSEDSGDRAGGGEEGYGHFDKAEVYGWHRLIVF